jgi:uncharacterized protein YbbK (DUF523 family)
MKTKVYVMLEESPSSGYITIKRMFHESELNEEYNYHVELLTKYDKNRRVESLEGFKLQHILVNVKYDGRKGIQDEDILKSLKTQGLVTQHGSCMFGGFYKPTDELKAILNDQYNRRKVLAGVA